MKAAIYNPYLDTLGGGERYTLAFAAVLIKKGYEVFLEWSDNSILEKLEKKFGINLAKVKIVPGIERGEGCDVCFWVSDGSVPLLKSRKNILHFQIPFKYVNGNSIMNKMKFFRINHIVCNSHFTKSFIDNEYGVKSVVLYPPVDIRSFKPKKKENIIAAVGRFSQLTQAKNQHILIEVFKKMVDKGLTGWELLIAGGAEVGANSYLLRIKKLSKNYPIKIKENIPFSDLKNLFGKAKIFWTATGFGIDESKLPTRVEHFGISTVEAMAGGSVPIAFNAGGHKETVEDEKNGFLWNRKNELLVRTMKLIENPKLLKEMSQNAQKSSVKYSYERFEEKVSEILK